MERRLCAIMCADVAGYSRLVRGDEERTIQRVNGALTGVVAVEVAQRNGRVVKLLGDGVLAEFASAVDAVDAAIAIQERMAQLEGDGDDPISFRIGLHVGDIIVRDGDILGDGVNVASRLESIGSPGEVVLSQSVADIVRYRTDVRLRDLGERELKNIDRPIRVWQATRGGPSPKPAPKGRFTLPSFVPTPVGKPTIAILPFQYLGSDADHAFLADGLRLGIQGTLVQLSGLFLIHPFTTNRYRDATVSAEQAAGEMNVRYILEGAVQAIAGRTRMRLQLTDTHERRVIWADRYDREFNDVFALEDEITHEVIDALGVELVAGEATKIQRSLVNTREAQEIFYRALNAMYEGSRAKNAEARKHFERLCDLDPNFVGGPSNLAVTHWLDYVAGWTEDPTATLRDARRTAERAISLTPNNGLGHTVLAHLEVLDRKHAAALELARRGVGLRSSCPMSHSHMANILIYCGKPDEAVYHARYALALEKVFAPWMVNSLAIAQRDAGDLAQARDVAAFAIDFSAENTEARVILASILCRMKDREGAREILRPVRIAAPDLTVGQYLSRQPYLDEATAQSIAADLHAAGLPC